MFQSLRTATNYFLYTQFTLSFGHLGSNIDTDWRESLYNIPGGHSVHPSSPLADKLENVPTGHGNNKANLSLSLGIRRNPEAIRAETRGLPVDDSGSLTWMASLAELIGFLGERIRSLFYKVLNYDQGLCILVKLPHGFWLGACANNCENPNSYNYKGTFTQSENRHQFN